MRDVVEHGCPGMRRELIDLLVRCDAEHHDAVVFSREDLLDLT
jgi:hypothetical protein